MLITLTDLNLGYIDVDLAKLPSQTTLPHHKLFQIQSERQLLVIYFV